MKNYNNIINKNLAIFLTLFSFIFSASAQDREYLKDGTIEEQINHVIEKSYSWENYKSVPNSWLSSLKRNTLDSLNSLKKEIDLQKNSLAEKETEINNLQTDLKNTKENLDKTETEKDTIPFLGILFSKNAFLTTVIIIFIVLIALMIIIFWLYNRGFNIIRKTQEELETTTKEFEDYRQESRKKYEQLVVQHHKEIQRFRGL
jgi:predicted PurR-regulated permease PerM